MRSNTSSRIAVQGLIIACVSAWLVFLPSAQAISPAPDGGYPSGNTAEGDQALFSLTSGVWDTAIGFQTLYHDTSGYSNTAEGVRALFSNTTGSRNTAVGVIALFNNTTGSNNIGIGYLGGSRVTTGSNNIDIGNPGDATDFRTTRIGTDGTILETFIAGIRGITTDHADAVPVVIDSTGQLGTTSSSARFKKEIKPMDEASEAILAFKPVTFQYKSDNTGTPQFGLIAEQVAKVNPGLIVRNADGEIYTVRYDAVNAMLLNEFLKEHRRVERLKTTVAKQEVMIAQQQEKMELFTAQLKKHEAQIQKVSAQMVVGKSAPQVVNNH